ncbi:hypothetical protein CEXT_520431 [Caerostris extrusa]|uniref:Uncharacterized protein n=1 Tax=Caerostris extrusa TaxID=172846 RepID=A0AAV4N3D3_CAEEX|nr:hypothetical protein CEXT_520431 [Caerostris extrusa]
MHVHPPNRGALAIKTFFPLSIVYDDIMGDFRDRLKDKSYRILQQANKVIWVEPRYHPTKHGGGNLESPRRSRQKPEVKQNIREVEL